MTQFLKKFITSNVINAIIIVNSIIIFILLFPNIPSHIHYILYGLDYTFNIYFLFEVLIKIILYKKEFYGKLTNIIDLILIFLITFALLNGSYNIAGNLYIIRIIRIIKCTKLFKIIPNYEMLLKNLKMALNTCCGIIIGLLIIMLITTILLTTIYCNISPEYFGNPIITMYTLFQLLTLEGWYEIPNNISMNSNIIIGSISKCVFSFIVLFGGIFGMSFITSTITDELASDNNDEVINKLNEIEKQIKILKEYE